MTTFTVNTTSDIVDGNYSQGQTAAKVEANVAAAGAPAVIPLISTRRDQRRPTGNSTSSATRLRFCLAS
jgi:hypothetical protein